METLLEKQIRFTQMVGLLIDYATQKGYGITLGEAWRPPLLAKIYAEKGIGSEKSLHCDRLAIDLNLFKNGRYLDKTEDHRELGEFWESIGGTWGGRFKDGNHYSLEYEGRK
jgi:hypothetical protein